MHSLRSGIAPTIRLGQVAALLVLLLLCGCGSGDSPVPPPINPTGSPTATDKNDACHVGGVTYCVLSADVTQDTINDTICVHRWTATVRPPVSYTDDLKRQQIAAENLTLPIHDYEEDHRMPLDLGGAPWDPKNLSPEYPASPNPKDGDERLLKDQVCSGQLTLAQAQQQMVSKWLAPYPAYKSS